MAREYGWDISNTHRYWNEMEAKTQIGFKDAEGHLCLNGEGLPPRKKTVEITGVTDKLAELEKLGLDKPTLAFAKDLSEEKLDRFALRFKVARQGEDAAVAEVRERWRGIKDKIKRSEGAPIRRLHIVRKPKLSSR